MFQPGYYCVNQLLLGSNKSTTIMMKVMLSLMINSKMIVVICVKQRMGLGNKQPSLKRIRARMVSYITRQVQSAGCHDCAFGHSFTAREWGFGTRFNWAHGQTITNRINWFFNYYLNVRIVILNNEMWSMSVSTQQINIMQAYLLNNGGRWTLRNTTNLT